MCFDFKHMQNSTFSLKNLGMKATAKIIARGLRKLLVTHIHYNVNVEFGKQWQTSKEKVNRVLPAVKKLLAQAVMRSRSDTLRNEY